MSEWAKRYLGWDHFPATLEALEVETFFTLAEDERAAIRSHRRDLNRLAVAIQIGYMRMTGMALNSVEMIPAAVLAHVAGQLQQPAPQLTSIRALYRRRRTIHDHQEAARQVLGLRALSEHARRKLKAHLRKIVPGQVELRELVREARRWLDHNRYLQIAERTLHTLAREIRHHDRGPHSGALEKGGAIARTSHLLLCAGPFRLLECPCRCLLLVLALGAVNLCRWVCPHLGDDRVRRGQRVCLGRRQWP